MMIAIESVKGQARSWRRTLLSIDDRYANAIGSCAFNATVNVSKSFNIVLLVDAYNKYTF
jgi:hypothetical protein